MPKGPRGAYTSAALAEASAVAFPYRPPALRGGLIPVRTISAPVAKPNLYRFVVRPLCQDHVRPRDGVE